MKPTFLVLRAAILIGGVCAQGQWKNVAIGGGGYVTDILAHPSTGRIYAKTDVGGVYYANRTHSYPCAKCEGPTDTTTWIPLLDAFTPENKSWYSVESLSLDPQLEDVLYVAVGPSAESYGAPGAIFTSRDAGTTW